MSAAGGGEPHLTGVETTSAAAERDTGAHVSAQLFFNQHQQSNVLQYPCAAAEPG